MPNLNNLEKRPLPEKFGSRFLQVKREDILHRTDLKVGFAYALIGLVAALAVAGGTYVIGKQLLK
jgi:hypothetical protein